MKKAFVIRDGVTKEYFGGDGSPLYWVTDILEATAFDSLESIESWVEDWARMLSGKMLLIEPILYIKVLL